MKRNVTFVAACLAAALSVPAVAQQARQGNAGEQLTQARRQVIASYYEQGDRMVEVPQRAIWELGALPPQLLNEALQRLPEAPDEAASKVMQAVNVLELHAALAQGDEAQRLRQAARDLSEYALRISFRQAVAPEQLRQPFAQAALAMADFYHQYAQRGMEQNTPRITGYSLLGASQYLTSAYALGGQNPSSEVSLAAYNADVLGRQIVATAKPTTYEADRGDGAARPAGERGDRIDLPDGTDQAIRDLRTAVRQASGEFDLGQLERGQREQDPQEQDRR